MREHAANEERQIRSLLAEERQDPPQYDRDHHNVGNRSPDPNGDDEQYDDRPYAPLKRRHSTLLSHPISDPVNGTSLICGLLAGISQAGVFNPYDRALYLSVRDHRPFLHRANFQNPYLGFTQSIGGRAIQSGLYFPMEHYFLRKLNADNSFPFAGGRSQHDATLASDPTHNFLAGTAAGAVNACLLNPLSAVKYKTWGRSENRGVAYEVTRMLRQSQSSLRPFFNGLAPTLARDVAFGGCYTFLRLQLQCWWNLESHNTSKKWLSNVCAAALATVVSGPFNYVRNVQFATKSHETADGMMRILSHLLSETHAQGPDAWARLRFLQQRLRIGWGTARVALGMSFAQAVYDWLHEKATSGWGAQQRSEWGKRI